MRNARRPCTWRALSLGAALCAGGLAGTVRAQEVPPAVAAAEQARVAAIAKATKAAVCVFDNGGQGGGSGVLISPDGFALTNFHVVNPCGNSMTCGLSDGKLYDAVVVGIDPTGDTAMIKLLGRTDFPAAEMGDSDAVQAGDWCFVIGNPFLLATDLQPTVSYGIISGTHRYQYPAGTLLEYADCLQTDAAINPGNSGGPLFNAQGQLIGINGRGSFEKRGRVNVGVGYAISINQIKKFLGGLGGGRIVDHATLGAAVSTDDEGKVVVSNILESSDAYRRGLRYGDEVVAFGGRPITTVNGFKNVLGTFPKGWRVPLSYRRDGQRHDVLVRLAGVHRAEELWESAKSEMPEPHPKPGDKPRPRPEPKPGEEPKKEKEGEPKLPLPLPKLGGEKEPKMPAAVAKVFEARPGYANYYFNKRERERVWKALSAKGSFADLPLAWKMEGELNGGRAVKVALGDKQLVGTFGNDGAVVDLEKDLDDQLTPPGTGGLLAALHLWQRLLVNGPQKYGEVYYLGQAPIPTREALADVLVATHGTVECRFYCDPATGELLGMEMFPDVDVDPCEVYFGDYRDDGGRHLPYQLEVRYGDGVYGTIHVKSWSVPAKEKSA